MIDSASAKQTLLDLADKVREYDAGAAVRLRLLGDAVDGVDDQAWAEGDIYRMIDPDSIVERFRSQQTRGRLTNFLEIARNTLVLAPIIVTWYGISQATDKYHILLSELLKTNPNQNFQPFLYLWQQGFGGRLPWFLTLSNIALFDAFLLLLIFILTFLTFALSQTSTSQNEQEAQQVRSEIVHALTGASLVILGKKKLTAGDNLEEVARKYDAMTRQTNAKFDAMIQQTLAQFNAMNKQVLDQFNATSTQVLDQFTDMTKQMNKQLQSGDAYLTKLATFVTGLDVLAKEMQASAQILKNTNTDLVAGINNLLAPMKEVAEQQKELYTSSRESVALLQNSARTLSDLGKAQHTWSDDLKDSLDTLEVAVEKVTLLASGLGALTTQQAAFLQQLGQEREAQRELATLMSAATVSVKEALATLNEGGRSLRSIAHDMKDIVDLQRASDNSSIVQTYSNAAHIIERSGNSLSASATAMYEASQKLVDVVDDLEASLTATKK